MSSGHPDRAPGLQKHGQRYRLNVTLDHREAEALAAAWDETSETPAAQARRHIGTGLARGRRGSTNNDP